MNSSFNVHTIGEGDTIQGIGVIYDVNWMDIADINGLEYPYIDDDILSTEYSNNDKVAKVGDQIMIPNSGVSIPNKTNNSAEELEKYALGCDLDIYSAYRDEFGVLKMDDKGSLTDNGQGDIKVSEGSSNLNQQLISRLGTPTGALTLHPEYGSSLLKYVGQRVTSELLIKVKLEVMETLLKDFRVKKVHDVNVEFRSGGVYVECVVQPIDPYTPFTLSNTYTVGG